MLLVAHFLALGVAVLIFLWMIYLHRRARRFGEIGAHVAKQIAAAPAFPLRPTTWVAIRSVTPEAVQGALGLDSSAPGPWPEGASCEHDYFISPRVNGWVIVTGPALPDPDDDVDGCFLFLTALSRNVGHVQFFHAEKFSRHHAWARLDDGCVTRAYAWSGETIWSQGAKTMPEIELGLRCFAYGDVSATKEAAEMNFEKVPALAARWSIDPMVLHRASGIAG
jgi:hypothetical protein